MDFLNEMQKANQKKDKQPKRKQAKDLNRHFTEEETPMLNNHMQR